MQLKRVNVVSSLRFRFQEFLSVFPCTRGGILNPVMAATLLTGAFIASPGAHADVLRLAHFMSPQHVMHEEVMAPWAKQIRDETGGELVVQIYPARQLGGTPPGQYKMAARGMADIAFGLQGYTPHQFPLSTVSELPGFAENANDATAKLWAFWDDHLQQEYADTKLLAIWTGDIAIIATRDKPVRTLEDLKGMRIRTPSKLSGNVLEALGASPVSMPVTEVYTSLERGIVDGVQIPLSAVKSFDLTEVANYFTTGAPLGFSPYFLVMNQKVYQGLPNNLRRTLDSTIGEALSEKGASAYEREREAILVSVRESTDAEIIELEEGEQDRWLDALAPVAQQWLELVDEAGVRSDGEKMLQQLGLGSERE
ncbi:TRAP transporter substrate-binding protein [Marinobacter sp. ATCH36]|uniref:TRAP transporter substrate-binding protein n=1 Tax=Marinobacter sp. ATCH36 TaxID=2945106 RepID=UPI002021BB41|nr:TRAP transporter substrate-binding protein [Marinobacter sp. ATCH36]MCL7942944.1 TRAP transporter substrate-binding protein [Marinobacter sp. ATCH36]